MKKTHIPFGILLLLLLSILDFTATYGQISGKVMDNGNEPIPYVNVLLYRAADTVIIKGASTSEEGVFLIEHESGGSYRVGLSSLGYTTYYTEIFEMGPNDQMDLGTIFMDEDANQLDEVVVSTKKSLVKNTPFGKEINVQSSLMTRGSTVLQVLERLPGIILDKRNDQFSLNGQNGVTVMFNGRKMPMSIEDLMALMESTSADTIDKIELITSPTAKYDADGGAGLINIVFKKNEYEGSQLNLSTSLGYGYDQKASTSLNYSYGKNKLSLNTSYSFSHDKGKNGFEGLGTSFMPIIGAPSETAFSTFFTYNNNIHNMNLGTVYQINPETEMGGDLAYSFSNDQNISNVNNSRYIENSEFIRSHLLTDTRTKKNNFMASLYLSKKLSEDSALKMDVNYLAYSNDSPAITESNYFNEEDEEFVPQNEIFTDGNRGQSKSTIEFVVLQADYSLKVSDHIDGEFGAKGSIATNTNDSRVETNRNNVWEVDPRSQSVISSDEKLWAAYAQFKFLMGEKSTLHAGLRYEDWKRTIDNANDPLAIKQFFPSVSYQHNFSERSNLSFNFHRRISRPSYADLVTSLYYNDPTAIFTGNPLLKPTLTNTLQLDYTVGGFNVGLSLQNEENPIIRYQLTSTPQNDILVVSPQNAEYQKSANLFLNIPVQWANWAKLNISSTSSLRKYRISYSPNPAEKAYFYQSFNFNQSIDLPYEMNMELSGWYNFDHYNGTNSTDGFGIVNFGLSKKLNKNWGTLQFTVTDIFKSFNVHTHISGMTPIIFDIDSRVHYRDESAFSRVFKLGYSLSFGNISNKKVGNYGEKEELKRVD